MGMKVNAGGDAKRRTVAARSGARYVALRRSMALALGALVLAAPSVRATSDAELATNARLLASARSEDAAGVVRALHDGAAVDSRNRLGETSLLVARGADVRATDRVGKNAITYAAGEGHTDVVRLLLRHGVDPNAAYRNNLTALMWAAGYGHAETVRALIMAGARIDLVDNRGKSALDMAREFKHAETVQALEEAQRRVH